MTEQEEQSLRDADRAKKRALLEAELLDKEKLTKKNREAIEAHQVAKHIMDEPARLAKEQSRKNVDLAREDSIKKEYAIKEAKREEKRMSEEPARLAKEEARRKIDTAREQAIDADLAARKLKNQK
jgi:hypothetical protein